MYSKMLIPYDLSDNSREALFVGERFLKEAPDHEVKVVHAVPLIATSLDNGEGLALPQPLDANKKIESKIRSDLHSLGYSSNLLNQVQILVSWGDPSAVILEAAEKNELIVMTTHGHKGLKKFLLGSVTEKMIHSANNPVFVVREASKFKPKKIMVPLSFEEASYEMLKRLLTLYPESESEYHLVHVLSQGDLLGMYQQMIEQPLLLNEELLLKFATKQLDDLCQKVFSGSVNKTILRGPFNEQILDASNKILPDLVVLGTHHRSGIKHFVMGSCAEKLVAELGVNVLCLGL